MDAQLCVKKKISQCNRTGILPGKCQSTVRGFLTVNNNNNDITTCTYIYIKFYGFILPELKFHQDILTRHVL